MHVHTRSSLQTFDLPNNSLDIKFEKAYQNRTTDQKGEQDKPQFMMVTFQNAIIPMHRTRFDQYQVSSVHLHNKCHPE